MYPVITPKKKPMSASVFRRVRASFQYAHNQSALIVSFFLLFCILARAATASYSFKQNLTIGSTGADITALQQILIAKGFLTAISAPTGYFGSATKIALIKFQSANGIYPATGYLGVKSRTFLNGSNNPAATTDKSHDLISQTLTIPENAATSGPIRTSITIPKQLVNQRMLINAAIAVICVGPATGPLQFYVLGSGVVINPNGYLLTNAHVVRDSRQCFLGRQNTDASDGRPPVAAVYNFLTIVGIGKYQSIENITSPTSEQEAASLRDFAVLKIGDRFTPTMWDNNHYQLNSLNIPVASDADYAKYFSNGKFPAIGVNFSYQPVLGDLLFMAGYPADTGRSSFSFDQGKVSTITINNIGTDMSAAQGLSGSPLVDSNSNLVGLNSDINCGMVGGGHCYTWASTGGEILPIGSPLGFTYGSHNLAINIAFLNQAMKEDLGFDLHELISRK